MNTARLVVLGIAVVAGGIAAMLASSGPDEQPAPAPAPVVSIDTVEILVAKADIGIGQTVGAEAMQWQIWPTVAAGPSFIRKTDKPDAIQEFAGAIARTPFANGEPIREAKLIKAKGSGFMAAILPAGMRAISTEISPETGAGGFILPNDHVDVILSRRDREAEKASGVEVHSSETILSNVRVLAIDQTVEDKNGQKVVVGKTATLELAPGQAEALARARQMGTLSLALRSIVDINGAPVDPNEGNSRRTGINMVRFGVTTTTTLK
jgi:pilus assembly protein CpaB